MTQASTKPLTFSEFLEWEADGVQYDLLAEGSLVEVPEETAISSVIALELAFWLASFVRRKLIKINCLTLEVNPWGTTELIVDPTWPCLHKST